MHTGSLTHVAVSPSSPPPPLPWITKSYQATYGVVSWCALLERGRQRYRRHYGHWLPLFRLLADVNCFSGERFEGLLEAGERGAALPVVFVILLHVAVYPSTGRGLNWAEDEYALPLYGKREKPFNVAVPPPANQRSSTSGGARWLVFSQGRPTHVITHVVCVL